ncbi:outer membrane protein [Bosea sp. MMO-172]|uniref:outer membrane protein n=1 Tax=Bosea sp. MMO-172 TaxID=3127885 RepID=UPI003015BC0C
MRIRSIAPGIGLIAIAATALAAPALAADYPVLRGSQIEDAPPAPSFGAPNWGGFYFGGSAGYVAGEFDAAKQSRTLTSEAFGNAVVRDAGTGLYNFGKASKDKVNFGGFIGYNTAFGDAILGVEAEYLRLNIQTDQRGSNGAVFQNLFATTVQSSPSTEPLNTLTAIAVGGHTTNKIDDLVMLKARAGYALGNFMPFANIGLAVGRVSTNAAMGQAHQTIENYSSYNTALVNGAITRTTFAGFNTIARPDGTASAGATQISSGYVPGIVFGAGIDALIGDNILFRAEYNRIYFSEYKGVNAVIDTARVGAGLKF